MNRGFPWGRGNAPCSTLYDFKTVTPELNPTTVFSVVYTLLFIYPERFTATKGFLQQLGLLGVPARISHEVCDMSHVRGQDVLFFQNKAPNPWWAFRESQVGTHGVCCRGARKEMTRNPSSTVLEDSFISLVGFAPVPECPRLSRMRHGPPTE